MPRLTAIITRSALLYLGAGFTLGALLLANKGLALGEWVWRLLPAHAEFLLIGWTVQFVLGVAFWILPRLGGGSRGREGLAVAAFGLLNLGVWLVALSGWLPGFELAGRAAEAGAVGVYLAYAWKRIRPGWQP
jgi:heme/copper-type cytochrome/quinol oxidase subunit 1